MPKYLWEFFFLNVNFQINNESNWQVETNLEEDLSQILIFWLFLDQDRFKFLFSQDLRNDSKFVQNAIRFEESGHSSLKRTSEKVMYFLLSY